MMTVEIETIVLWEKLQSWFFYSIKNHNSCLCLILFSFRIDSVRYILCFESEDNNDDNEKFKKIYEKNPFVGFDSIKITTLNLAWYTFRFYVTQSCNRNDILFLWLIETTQCQFFDQSDENKL